MPSRSIFLRRAVSGALSPRSVSHLKMSQKNPKASSKAAVSKGSGTKSKGNFISRQAKAKKAVTEEDLLTKQTVTPDHVLALEAATEGA